MTTGCKVFPGITCDEGWQGMELVVYELGSEKVVEVVGEGSGGGGAAGPVTKKDSWKIEKEDALDLAGLLNVLDGVVDSPGRVVVMTTNHPEKLDPALIRPGRINKRMLLGYLLLPEATRMVEHYFGALTNSQLDGLGAAFTPNVFTPAQVEQLCAEYDSIDDFLTLGLPTLGEKQY